jgi:cytochrome o ubiquinol oxidase subunit II
MKILNPHGPIGAARKTILIDPVAIVLPTIVAMIAFAFRQVNIRATYRPDFACSARIELLVWSAPVLTVNLLVGIAWIARLGKYTETHPCSEAIVGPRHAQAAT